MLEIIMNFDELSKRERRFALELLWEIEKALAHDQPAELEVRLSMDYDPTACQEFLRDMCDEIKRNRENADKYFTVKSLLK